MKPRILILSYALGTGHTRAAQLLKGALASRGAEAVHAPLEKWVPFEYDLLFRRGYLLLATRIPFVWDRMYRSRFFSSRGALAPPGMRIRARRRFHRRGFGDWDLVLATQINAMEVAADWKRKHGAGTKLAVVVTDYDIYPGWARPEVDCYFVAHQDLAAELVRLGVEPSRVSVSGIPIDPAFESTGAIGKQPRFDLGLEVDRPVLLLLGGGLGVGPLEEAVRSSLRVPGWQVVAVCGKNRRLRTRLIPLAQAHPSRLRLLGYRRDLPRLMHACDAVVTKGGGLGLTEALQSGKPVVAISGFPGQETANIGFLVSKGWISACGTPEEIPAVLESLSEKASQCPLPAGALDRIADALMRPAFSG